MPSRTVIESGGPDFMPFRARIKRRWQFSGKILDGVAEIAYICSEIIKKRSMTYFSWDKRSPREFRGKPQWTLDELYISPFTARRRYDEEGVRHYDAIARNTAPTGVQVMDHYLRRLSEGKEVVKDFCPIYGLRTEDMEALIYILTGMRGQNFRMALRQRGDTGRYRL